MPINMHYFGDRVKQYGIVTGTDDVQLSGSISGYRTFSSGFGSTDKFDYCIVSGAYWEVGQGYCYLSNGVYYLVRSEPFRSTSGSFTKVNWGTNTTVTIIGGIASDTMDKIYQSVGCTLKYPGTLAVNGEIDRFYHMFSIKYRHIDAWVMTAPTGADLIFNIKKNLTTFTSQTIPAGTSRLSMQLFSEAGYNISTTDYLSLGVQQVGSTVPGSDLYVRLSM